MYALTEEAAIDVENILNQSVIDFGLIQTEHYYNSLKNCLEILGNNPDMGSVADDIQPGYRRFTHEGHVIFYRDSGNPVLLLLSRECRAVNEASLRCETYCKVSEKRFTLTLPETRSASIMISNSGRIAWNC